jgi:hypothetical protein
VGRFIVCTHSPPSGTEVKEWVELYLHSQYAFMAWCLVKAQGELYLYFTLPTVEDISTPFRSFLMKFCNVALNVKMFMNDQDSKDTTQRSKENQGKSQDDPLPCQDSKKESSRIQVKRIIS